MKSITSKFNDEGGRNINVKEPDRCPFCHHSIDPLIELAFCNEKKWNIDECLQVVYRCTREDCKKLFISYYKSLNGNCNAFEYQYSRPIKKEGKLFSETIKEISPSFDLIYNQAFIAEQDDLREICGVGYRKSLEFLIKDYLIRRFPDKEKEFKDKFLGKCIDENIPNDNIKKMAKRATWLGNDETHYLKKWEGKDLSDLKKIIDVTIYWIEMEKLTKDVEEEMSE